MAKEACDKKKKKNVFTSQLGLNLRNKLAK